MPRTRKPVTLVAVDASTLRTMVANLDAVAQLLRQLIDQQQPATPPAQLAAMRRYMQKKRRQQRLLRKKDVQQRQRQELATLLARYDPAEIRPATASQRKMASLISAGYLKKNGDGYIRTDKPFTV